MTEIEQLRKELNELRERLALLEARPVHHYPELWRAGQPIAVDLAPKPPTAPIWLSTPDFMRMGSGTVTCAPGISSNGDLSGG